MSIQYTHVLHGIPNNNNNNIIAKDVIFTNNWIFHSDSQKVRCEFNARNNYLLSRS